MAGRFGSARRKCDLAPELARVILELEQVFGAAFQAGADLTAAADATVRMDPDRLFLALYFGVYCLAGESPAVTATVSSQGDEPVRLAFTGPGVRLHDDLRRRASSKVPDILLGEDEIAIGLSTVKAFAHRCQGSLEVSSDPTSTTLTLILPRVPDIKSFLD